MQNPYVELESSAFWRSAVADRSCFDVSDLWVPKFRFDRMPIYTAGSCFAQHFGRALSKAGLRWIDAEQAPTGSSEALKRKFNYGIFSTRTANIYTTPMLRQWLELCFTDTRYDEVWETDGRFYDPLRPMIEPNGFASVEEFNEARERTITAMRSALEEGCVFVFTLGLTESWMNKETGMHYAACPGTQAGTFDPKIHVFKNLSYPETLKNLRASIKLLKKANKRNKILLTVSPVPLTATASDDHVLVATTKSKSILRSVAAAASSDNNGIDYFPSYEIITGAPFRSMWFEPNMRSVRQEGVDFVMKNFFREHEKKFGTLRVPKASGRQIEENNDDVVCEEVLLEAFGRV